MKVEFDNNLPDVLKAVEEATDAALFEMGERAVGYAKALAPVDTGNMRDAIVHERYDKNTEIFGTSDTFSTKKPDVQYAQYVELGTSRMRAQPFIRPAAEGHREEYRSIAESTLQAKFSS